MKIWFKEKYIFITLFIPLLVGIIIVYLKWADIRDDFFKINFADVFQVIATWIIALFVTSYVGEKTGNSNKRKEIILKILDEFRDRISEMFNLSTTYMENSDKSLEKSILACSEKANYQLNSLIELKKNGILNCLNFGDDLENCCLKFKIAVTESPFRTNNVVYDETKKNKVYTSFYELIKKIDTIRYRLYK
ncbi:MAG: hypothetical protein WCW17_00290 [Patescibacteria group bacterium]|jgi:hypothetical protein